MKHDFSVIEGNADKGFFVIKDYMDNKEYNLTYNSGVDFILISESVDGSEDDMAHFELINYFHGELSMYTIPQLLWNLGYYLDSYRGV